MKATVSLLGLYNFDNSILDGLTLPSNFDSGDRQILIDNLLVETCELEILYTRPDFLKTAITTWCNNRKATWKWLKDTQSYDYNPIWNADYKIDDHTVETNDTQDDLSHRSTTNYEDDARGNETHSGKDTTLNSVYAYNDSSTGTPDNKSELTHGHVINTTHHDESTTGNTATDNRTIDHDRTNYYTRYLRGNYGQTTTQDMIKQEQELAQLNLIDYIIEDFKKRFCILVY